MNHSITQVTLTSVWIMDDDYCLHQDLQSLLHHSWHCTRLQEAARCPDTLVCLFRHVCVLPCDYH
jgi:hypothetical protein